MNTDQALADVRGMVKAFYLRGRKMTFSKYDSGARDRLAVAGFTWKLEEFENGKVYDYTPMNWELRTDGPFVGKLGELLEDAKKDMTAFKAANSLTGLYLTYGRALPPALANHVRDRLDGKAFPKKEKRGVQHRGRDEMLAMLVKYLVRKTDNTPYRSDATPEGNCGIDQVLKAIVDVGGPRYSYNVARDAYAKYGPEM